MASLAAAAGSAATVVQLADFSAKVIKSTASFVCALGRCSKELEKLRQDIKTLEQLTEHIRRLACSYQNSKLGLTLENQQTLELLGQALTVCSIDLQAIQDAVQKKQADSYFVALKQKVAYVVDEDRLKRLSLRLDGDVAFICGLLSCISMSNDATIHKSVEHVVGLLSNTLPGQLAHIEQDNNRNLSVVRSRVNGISDELRRMDNSISVIDQRLIRLSHRMPPASLPSNKSVPCLKGLSNSLVNITIFLQTLELFAPIARSAFAKICQEQHGRISQEAIAWVLAALYGLLSDVNGAVADAHTKCLMDRPNCSPLDFESLEMPKRFRRQTLLEKNKAFNMPGCSDGNYTPDDDTPNPLPRRKWQRDSHSPTACHTYMQPDSTGNKVLFYAQCSLDSRTWPLAPTDSGRISLSFIPKRRELPGVAVAFSKITDDDYEICDTSMTAFDVRPQCTPIVRAVRAGDAGVSEVLKRLRAREAWAGDRDETGRSLLSHAVESGSRDMCTLLLRMGADPQDVDSMGQLEFEPLQHSLMKIKEEARIQQI